MPVGKLSARCLIAVIAPGSTCFYARNRCRICGFPTRKTDLKQIERKSVLSSKSAGRINEDNIERSVSCPFKLRWILGGYSCVRRPVSDTAEGSHRLHCLGAGQWLAGSRSCQSSDPTPRHGRGRRAWPEHYRAWCQLRVAGSGWANGAPATHG